jgi:hypothetical protein
MATRRGQAAVAAAQAAQEQALQEEEAGRKVRNRSLGEVLYL